MLEFALILICGFQFGVIVTVLTAIYMEKRSNKIPAGKSAPEKKTSTKQSPPIPVGV